jgi:uracil-DNA glycosylase
MTFKEELGDWFYLLKDKVNLNEISNLLGKEYLSRKVYPTPENVFKVFKILPYNDIKVIILGLDPYHNGQATGIAFGVDSKPIPASLRIIKSEMETSVYNTEAHNFDYSLELWVKQGVFLLNTALTVVEGNPTTHCNIWRPFTTAVFEVLNEIPGKIFVLWGNEAKKYQQLINPKFHHVLMASHPAAEAYRKHAGFYGCNHFNVINEIIEEQNGKEARLKW